MSKVNLNAAFFLEFIEQWLIHDDGNGGAAIMSKYNKKYVVPTDNGGISNSNAPYFWEISKNGTGYRSVLIRTGDTY